MASIGYTGNPGRNFKTDKGDNRPVLNAELQIYCPYNI